jgi:hypothetical protein
MTYPMRRAARAAGFAIHVHERGFSGILNTGPGAPLLLFVLNSGEFEIRGEDIGRQLRRGRGLAEMVQAIRFPTWRARTPVRHFGTVSAALADGGFIVDGDDGLVAYVSATEAARSGVSLRAGAPIEYSILLGGAAVAVTLATEPQADDRHLLDGVAKASDRTAEDTAGSLMAGIIAAAMV